MLTGKSSSDLEREKEMQERRMIVVATVLALGIAYLAQAGDDARLASLREAGTKASLTVYPFVLGEQPMAQVGAVVGVMMEQAGLEDVGVDETVFSPEKEAALEEIAEAFGVFIREREIDRRYALYGEYRGSRSAGITEIVAVLVDSGGNVVWADRQAPGDADFDRAAPKNPMECCVFVAERLKQAMALPDLPAGAERKAGRLERSMTRAAGVPEEAEFAAMEERVKVLAEGYAGASVEIYPVRIGKMVNRDEAERLSTLLEENGFGIVRVAGTDLPIDVPPDNNEQAMLWTMARSFREYIRSNPPDADYVLYADYLMRWPDGPVGAVHFVICDREGEWVVVDFQNSHHKDFKKVGPKNAGDCGRLAARRVQGYVR
jgi:hypothetical protein